jgi:hypothetical protein
MDDFEARSMSANESESRVWAEKFLFGESLYAECDISPSVAADMFVTSSPLIVDGHCWYCQRSATFLRISEPVEYVDSLLPNCDDLRFELACVRNGKHRIVFFFRFHQGRIQKIGQYPSLADIVNDESRSYRQMLEPADASDLHRAIGLAAHGVGVGSFVYLRRVFERLITRRFTEFKDSKRWGDDALVGKSMDDKIEFLKDHLPDFLVRNKRVYAILSKGIHELSEGECLAAFEFLKRSIFYILADDRRKKEELDSRRNAEAAIADFSSGRAPPR